MKDVVVGPFCLIALKVLQEGVQFIMRYVETELAKDEL